MRISFGTVWAVCWLLCGTIIWVAVDGAWAEEPAEPEMRGAAAILEAAHSPAVDPAGGENAERSEFHKQLDAFAADREQMKPAEQAQAWLSLFDAATRAKADPAGDADEANPTLVEVMSALPGPAAWPALDQAARQRLAPAEGEAPWLHDQALAMFTALLVKDQEALAKQLTFISDKLAQQGDSWEVHNAIEYLQELGRVVGINPQEPDLVAAFMKELEEAERDPDAAYWLDVPSLVPAMGEADARPLLLRALKTKVHELDLSADEKTLILLREVAMANMADLPRPRWQLVDDLGTAALYEAMYARFIEPQETDQGADGSAKEEKREPQDGGGAAVEGEPAEVQEADADQSPVADALRQALARLGQDVGAGEDWEGEDADFYGGIEDAWVWYVLSLVADGRADDAVAQLKQGPPGADNNNLIEFPYYALARLDRAGFGDGVFELLDRVLAERPTLPLWPMYRSIAVRVGKADRMLALAERVADQQDLTGTQRAWVLTNLIECRLASAQTVEDVAQAIEAVDEFCVLFETLPGDPEGLPTPRNLAITQINAGRVVDRPEWINRGIDRYLASDEPEDAWRWYSQRDHELVLDAMIGAGRLAEAEAFLLKALKKQMALKKLDALDQWHGQYDHDDLVEMLVQLAALYDRADRPADVLILLKQSVDWGQRDLAQLIDKDALGRSLGLMAARALHAAGQDAEALPIVEEMIARNPGDDDAYAMLLEVADARHAEQILTSWFERDQFEERPLIWLAQLHLNQGDSAKALALIQRAVAIDPSDGEQGRGDRMRAYAVMADIYRAAGDDEKAKFFDDVVAAIRLAEDADLAYGAGLLYLGIAMYEKSVALFADAYCIQSRLAIQLADLGFTEKAAEHYRRAYELMPSSFGRVESHCFGCEGAFSGEQAQSIAEQVFTGLSQDQPDNPQVHYLLGYLRGTQDKHAQALASFQRAVELDPDYLNAWKKISGLAYRQSIPTELRDHAILRQVRLDPLGRHSSPRLGTVYDLAMLWSVVDSVQEDQVEETDELFLLPAAAKELGQATDEAGLTDMPPMPHVRRSFDDRDGYPEPAQLLAEHAISEALMAVILASGEADRAEGLAFD